MSGAQGGFVPPDGGQRTDEGRDGAPYEAGARLPYEGRPGAYGARPDSHGGWPGAYGIEAQAEPSRPRRTGLIVGLAIGAVVVVGGAAALVGVASSSDHHTRPDAATGTPSSDATSPADASPAHSLVLPRRVGPYRRLTGKAVDRIVRTTRQSLVKEGGQYADVYAKWKIALYTNGGPADRGLMFIGMSAKDSPKIAELMRTTSPSEEVDQMFLAAGVHQTTNYPTGPLGGVLRCSKGDLEYMGGMTCAWADSSTVGMAFQPKKSAATLARITLRLRNAAER